VTGVPSGGPGADYFRNGAAVTGVPSSGPGAAYFQNGAEVLAYYTPPVAPVEHAAAGEVDAGPVASTASASPAVEDASLQSPPAATESASAAAPMPSPVGSACPTCATFDQIEAALANASRCETPAPAAAISCAESAAAIAIPRPTQTVSTFPTEPAVSCPSGPSPLSRIGTVLGGALLGGLAVVLWSRPRSLRVQAHHR